VRARSCGNRSAHYRYDCAPASDGDWRLHEDVEAKRRFGWRVCSAVLCCAAARELADAEAEAEARALSMKAILIRYILIYRVAN
jgi:hypothetical protein